MAGVWHQAGCCCGGASQCPCRDEQPDVTVSITPGDDTACETLFEGTYEPTHHTVAPLDDSAYWSWEDPFCIYHWLMAAAPTRTVVVEYDVGTETWAVYIWETQLPGPGAAYENTDAPLACTDGVITGTVTLTPLWGECAGDTCTAVFG